MRNHHAKLGTVLGSFGKGVRGSYALNFAPSGGSNCSDTCSLKNNGCYAQTVEKMKGSITKNTAKKQANLGIYLAEILKRIEDLKSSPWIRFSAFGSVPATVTQKEKVLFQAIAANLPQEKTHFPIEDHAKAMLYRSMGFQPRLSLGLDQTVETVKDAQENFPLHSLAYGESRSKGKNNKNTNGARTFAKELNSEGISAVVCPAIAANSKCGNCRACASPKVKVVIYPFHV